MRRLRSVIVFIGSLSVALAVGCRAQAPPAAESLRDDFRRALIDNRRPEPLNPQPVSQADVGTGRVERVRITTEPGQTAVVAISRPKMDRKYPAVVVQHFLGGSKDHPLMALLSLQLVQHGFLVAQIDGRYRGERQNGKSLDAAMVEALRTGKGHPFLLDTAYDVLRELDYLQTRADVDAAHIGMTGISEGGIITWMCAAADDRIKVAVPVIGITSFGETMQISDGPEVQARLKLFDAVLKEYARDLGEKEVNSKVLRGLWQKLVPGLLDRFDAPKIVPLIAPRPLLLLSHEQDELFPVAGAKAVYEAAKAAYHSRNADDRLDFRVAPGKKHADYYPVEITGMTQWLERWLEGAAG